MKNSQPTTPKKPPLIIVARKPKNAKEREAVARIMWDRDKLDEE